MPTTMPTELEDVGVHSVPANFYVYNEVLKQGLQTEEGTLLGSLVSPSFWCS